MPQRRQNSIVRTPIKSILGWSITPSVFSISVQALPRQPRSPANAKPIGPAPTIRTGVRAVIGRFSGQLVTFVTNLTYFAPAVETMLQVPMHHKGIDQAERRMSKHPRQGPHDGEPTALPQPYRPLVAGDDEVELHGREAALTCVVKRMGAHHPCHPSTGSIGRNDVTAVGHMAAAAAIVGAQEIRSENSLPCFGDENIMPHRMPIGESVGA